MRGVLPALPERGLSLFGNVLPESIFLEEIAGIDSRQE